MKIGILADIHGHVGNLKKAIARLRLERVDLFVVLGDVIYNGVNAPETVAMLKDCEAVGVFGNHELGLCVDPRDDLRRRYDDYILDFFQSLKPQFETGELLFSHTLPDQDASDPFSYFLGPHPEEEGALDNCFAKFSQHVIMTGHFHKWFAATPAGRIAWSGEDPIKLDPHQRYFFVIDAVMNGHAAVLDDEQKILSPVHV
jgi:hypothetical protein